MSCEPGSKQCNLARDTPRPTSALIKKLRQSEAGCVGLHKPMSIVTLMNSPVESFKPRMGFPIIHMKIIRANSNRCNHKINQHSHTELM